MALEKFHYKTQYGEVVGKRFKDMPMGIVRRNRKNPSEATWSLIEHAFDKKSLKIVDQLTPDEFADFESAWVKGDSGLEPGESGASSKS